MKKVLILMGVLLIPILFIILNNTGRGTVAKDNIKTVAKVFGFYFIDIQVFNLFLVDFRYI